MDAFRTADERKFRLKARDYFLALARDGSPRPPAPVPPEKIWRDLEGGGEPEGGAALRPGVNLSERVSIVEEAASQAPRLGQDLLAWRLASGAPDPAEELLLGLGRLAGTAAHVLEAATRAGRDRGAFSSSLMGCREIQEELAGLAAGTELLRLGTCRLCRLLNKDDRDRAKAESARLRALAALLVRDVLSVARGLLGEPWVRAHLPDADIPPGNERTRP